MGTATFAVSKWLDNQQVVVYMMRPTNGGRACMRAMYPADGMKIGKADMMIAEHAGVSNDDAESTIERLLKLIEEEGLPPELEHGIRKQWKKTGTQLVEAGKAVFAGIAEIDGGAVVIMSGENNGEITVEAQIDAAPGTLEMVMPWSMTFEERHALLADLHRGEPLPREIYENVRAYRERHGGPRKPSAEQPRSPDPAPEPDPFETSLIEKLKRSVISQPDSVKGRFAGEFTYRNSQCIVIYRSDTLQVIYVTADGIVQGTLPLNDMTAHGLESLVQDQTMCFLLRSLSEAGVVPNELRAMLNNMNDKHGLADQDTSTGRNVCALLTELDGYQVLVYPAEDEGQPIIHMLIRTSKGLLVGNMYLGDGDEEESTIEQERERINNAMSDMIDARELSRPVAGMVRKLWKRDGHPVDDEAADTPTDTVH